MREAARTLVEEFEARAAVVKGGHLDLTDVLYWEGGEFYEFRGEKVNGFTHGTGCAFSSALASLLARGGMELPEAVRGGAKRFVETAIGFSSAEGGRCVNPPSHRLRSTPNAGEPTGNSKRRLRARGDG